MWKTVRAVLWAFLGIRSSKGYEHDQQKLRISHVIITGIACTLVFVIGLFFLVRMLTAK